MAEVTAKRKYEQLKLYIDGLPHLHLRLLDLTGFQTWIHGESEYFVEYYFNTGNKITTVYGNRDLWINVLNCLDKAITV